MPSLRPRCWWPDGVVGDDSAAAGRAGFGRVGAGRAATGRLMIAYHDDEWAVPVSDDRELFERLALESFQAGLAWVTILRKREAFRSAFDGFDPILVARYDDTDRARLLGDAGIVRNRAKIEATIGNAADEGSAGTMEDFGPKEPVSLKEANV